jgi:hypothetical protein
MSNSVRSHTEEGDGLPEPNRVSVGGVIEVDRGLLEGPPEEAQDADTPAAAALRALIAEPGGIEDLPPSGWRVLQRTDELVTFGAFDDQRWHGWVVCTVELRDNGWALSHSSYGAQLMPTRRQRGHGLHLEWTEEEYSCRAGDRPQVSLRLINERKDRWIDDRGEYWGIATLVDATTGKEVPSTQGVAIAGTGRAYDLAPGEWVRLPVALAVDEVLSIPPGLYQVRASVHDLALEAPPGRLRVRADHATA